MNKDFDPNKRIEAVWTIDSETGRRYLIDVKTNKIIAVLNPDTGFYEEYKGQGYGK